MKKHVSLANVAKLLLGVLGVIIMIIGIGITIMLLAPDGTANYSGVKLEAARSALAASNSADGLDKLGSVSQVLSIQKDEDDCTNDREDKRYYSVTVRRVWLFGTTLIRATYSICRIT